MELANAFGFFLFLATYMLAIWGYWKFMAGTVGKMLGAIFGTLRDVIFHDSEGYRAKNQWLWK